ncbi:MAG: transcriptional repressor LexA [Planctomycetota bacterium]|jgi:repressor LexA
MTPKQLAVLRIVEEHQTRKGYAPTLQEIADRLGVTKVTVLSHLRHLERDKHIKRSYYRRRSIKVLTPTRGIPLVGTIAAGEPIEAVESPEDVDVFGLLREGKEYYALRVRGRSMIDDGIREGDVVICEKRTTARNGETVVALLDGGEATLKRLYREDGRIRLQPANEKMKPLVVSRAQVQGVVVGVFRKL